MDPPSRWSAYPAPTTATLAIPPVIAFPATAQLITEFLTIPLKDALHKTAIMIRTRQSLYFVLLSALPAHRQVCALLAGWVST